MTKKKKAGFDELFGRTIGRFLSGKASPEKLLSEIFEHSRALLWALKMVFLPLAVFYFVLGLFLNEYVVGSIFLSLIIFLYSNFLPDTDTFVSADFLKSAASKPVKKFEKYKLLIIAPVYIYYVLSEKIVPVKFNEIKPFHNLRCLIAWSIFLLFIGIILHASLFKAFFIMLFAASGYFTHLFIDGYAAHW